MFSVDPAFLHATIGRFYTMPACLWSKYFSVITFSKYENNRKTKPKIGRMVNLMNKKEQNRHTFNQNAKKTVHVFTYELTLQ